MRSTSAPRSESTIAANGAGPRPANSITRKPERGPVMPPSLSEATEDRKGFVHVLRRIDLRVERVTNHTLLVDHVGDAARQEAQRGRNAEARAHLAALVGQ